MKDADPTEAIRRIMVEKINSDPVVQDGLTTEQLSDQYEVEGFMAPFVVVCRKGDGVRGSMEFRHHPRVYFNFMEDRPWA